MNSRLFTKHDHGKPLSSYTKTVQMILHCFHAYVTVILDLTKITFESLNSL